MLMICKPTITPDVIIKDQAWNFCVFNCLWRRVLQTPCHSSATSVSAGLLIFSPKKVYENGGKYQRTTVSMATDYVYLLYVYIFGFIYIFICMYAHKIIPLFSQSSSCFSFNFKMKTKK